MQTENCSFRNGNRVKSCNFPSDRQAARGWTCASGEGTDGE